MDFKEKLKDKEFINELIKEYSIKKTEEISFIINEKPISYSRERAGKFSFYNPKGKEMKRIRKQLKEVILKENPKLLEIVNNPENDFQVSLELSYYIEIQKSGSIKTKCLKELGLIRPNLTPDLDNFDKFILDVLHEILYFDDKKVIEIHSNKFYSSNPRTEIKAKIEIIKEV